MDPFKFAISGTVAMLALATVAKADALSEMKIQMASLERDTVNRMVGNNNAYGKDDTNVHVILIGPTADAPAAAAPPATVLSWSGYARVGLVAGHDNIAVGTNGFTGFTNGYPLDMEGRAKFKVVASTETDMGTFGVSLGVRSISNAAAGLNGGNNGAQESFGSFNGGRPGAVFDGYYGWWKTGNITFSGGNGSALGSGSLVYNSFTFDAACTCQYGNNGWGAISMPRNGKPFSNSSANTPITAVLSYQDGPLLAGIGIEDAGNVAAGGNGAGALGFSGKLAYNNDLKAGNFGLELSGGYWGAPIGNAAWSVIAGGAFKYDPITLGMSIGTGNVGAYGTTGVLGLNADYTIGNLYAVAALSPTFTAELGFVHDFGTNVTDITNGASLFEAGLYWKPKKQFVLGVEGQYQSGGLNDAGYTAAAITRWSF